ncbi:TetR/AcrR family transcriptional regulator [Carnobacterium sp.]|uniref:TetR/AcrR family transcriptional regulator n=1 Tax=Carnobacterium sp. TaxID=48221 RepID=UPI002FCC7F69
MKEEREQRILDAAMSEFATHSYYEAKTDRIAEIAKVSKGLIFHYFGSKEKLYLQTVQAALTILINAVDLDQAPKKDLVQLVVWSTTKKIFLSQEYPLAFRLVLQSYGNAPKKLQSQLQEFYQEQQKKSYEVIEHVLNQMSLKPEVSKEVAVSLIQSVFENIQIEAQRYLKANPEATATDFEFLFTRTKEMLYFIQYGMCEVN